MILPPSDPFSMSLIPCLPHNALHFHLCCRYFTSCHPFRLFRQLCLSNSFPSITLSLSTSLAALGSYAYPILSHTFPSLMSSSPPFCNIELFLPHISGTFHAILLTDYLGTFYDTLRHSIAFPVVLGSVMSSL